MVQTRNQEPLEALVDIQRDHFARLPEEIQLAILEKVIGSIGLNGQSVKLLQVCMQWRALSYRTVRSEKVVACNGFPTSAIQRLSRFPNLTYVILGTSHYQLEDAHLQFLPQCVPALEHLHLYHEGATSLTRVGLTAAFAKFCHLSRLQLHCDWRSDEASAIAALTCLTCLDTRLTQAQAFGFKGDPLPAFMCKQLQELNLSVKSHRQLPAEMFSASSPLRRLSLTGYGIQLPHTFTSLRSLESLELSQFCASGVPLGQFTRFSSLRRLHLEDLMQCTYLPPDFFALPELQVLSLRVTSLPQLPDTISQLSKLTFLKIETHSDSSSVGRQEELPDALGFLPVLLHLHLGCSALKSLPSTLGMLRCLTSLEIAGSLQLQSLPESIGQLKNLRWLRLNAVGISTLPHSIGRLSDLTRLDVSDCQCIAQFPSTFGQLSSLRELRISMCALLSEVNIRSGQLPCLELLFVSNCSSLTVPEHLEKREGLRVEVVLL